MAFARMMAASVDSQI
jgi:hypothetical protein